MKKVVIGISGGVDSITSAYLLKEVGYEVIGVSFKFIDDFSDTEIKEICNKIGIKHETIDYRVEFKKEVIDKFIEDYKNGITPNPCVDCNKKVKIKFLYEQMLKLNCDYMATGHYAKMIDSNLYKSKDLVKDQTYFLAGVDRKILSKMLFPLEDMNKEEVRELAKKISSSVASKKDSTDVCFITDKFREYINENIKMIPGDVVNIETGEVIGKHNGLALYTIGQRKGLNLGGFTDRLFVVGKDLDKNILYVALGDNNDYLLSDSCIISDVNFLTNEKISNCMAKFRYKSKEYNVSLEYLDNNEILVKYDNIKSITPGQACVLYDNDRCLLSGTIKTVFKDNKKIGIFCK